MPNIHPDSGTEIRLARMPRAAPTQPQQPATTAPEDMEIDTQEPGK